MAGKSKIKEGIKKATSNNYNMNKKAMNFKRSWDEVQKTVNGMLNNKGKAEKK